MHIQEIINFGKLLYEKNLTVATSGNISIKTEDGIYITATGTALGFLERKDVVLVDYEGKEISKGKASSEIKLHVAIYRKRPDIKAIIHTHSVYLTTFASCHKNLDEAIMSENILYFEEIPVAEYAMPSSVELVENTVKYMDKRDVVMMANHGAVSGAEDLKHAFLKLETAEYYAHVCLNTKLLGGAKYLTNKDVEDIIRLKSNLSNHNQ